MALDIEKVSVKRELDYIRSDLKTTNIYLYIV